MGAKFKLGVLMSTADVASLLSEDAAFAGFVRSSILQYEHGLWGDMTEEDKALNDDAVLSGEGRIHGVYTCREQEDWTIWIITERDRSVTTVLFPHEY